MAKMTIKGTDQLELQLSKLGNMSTKIAKDVVMAGAQPVADEIRKGLENNLAGSKYSKGDLLDSLGIAPPGVDNQGNVNTKIGFDGYDSNGVANQLKARVMESGSSKQQKKPFVRPAVNRSKNRALEAMQKKFDEKIELIIE
jgi:HK97 gp10 family phage protein